MGVLADHQIQGRCYSWRYPNRGPMIEPYVHETQRQSPTGDKIVSYGVTSYGYDARLAGDFLVFHDTNCAIMDPKNVDQSAFVPKTVPMWEALIIPPHGYVLAHTIETFDIPRDVAATCIGKSTYARSGILINVTPLEPEWRGQVTLEIANLLPIPSKVYVGEGICQFVFHVGDAVCNVSYADKGGKYQDQKGVVTSR